MSIGDAATYKFQKSGKRNGIANRAATDIPEHGCQFLTYRADSGLKDGCKIARKVFQMAGTL